MDRSLFFHKSSLNKEEFCTSHPRLALQNFVIFFSLKGSNLKSRPACIILKYKESLTIKSLGNCLVIFLYGLLPADIALIIKDSSF